MWKIVHVGDGGTRAWVVVEVDEEVYRIMRKLKTGSPYLHSWLLPHPGGRLMVYLIAKALLVRVWGAGVEGVANVLGVDDRSLAGGSTYRSSHHLLTVASEDL